MAQLPIYRVSLPLNIHHFWLHLLPSANLTTTMRVKTDNPWRNRPYYEGLVDVGTHSLWASTSGPIRKHNDPLVIFITGAGAPCAVYVKLQQRLSCFARTLFSDRAGYDQSTLPPLVDKIYAEDSAHGLTKLLSTTQLKPPYVLVAHSYGGIIARSFLEIHKDNPDVVVGMMLLDTATELMLALIPRIPPTELGNIARNVNWEKLTNLKQQSGMTDEEWHYALSAHERSIDALKKEDTHASAHQLALRYQLDTGTLEVRPLSVVRCNMTRDYQMLYDAGVENGDGTEDERKKARDFIQTFRVFHDQIARAQCRLSKDATYMYYDQWGHDLPMRRPMVAVEDIRKLLARVCDKYGQETVGHSKRSS
jgi:pimeloyl-ACP methyl ester carboxylesterase